LGVVVLTNGTPIGVPEAIADTIVDDAVNGSPTRDWGKYWHGQLAGLLAGDPKLDKPPADSTPAKPASAYVGSYDNPYYGTYVVRADAKGQLTITEGPAHRVFPLTHWSANTFTMVESPDLPNTRSELTFDIGPAGTATSLHIGGEPGVDILHRVG
ncbi:MAG: DUF3471 domain-containing protein, partial [Trebonia sp.]